MKFRMTDEVRALGVQCACFVQEGMRNRAGDAEFDRYREDLFGRLREVYSEETVAVDPILEGFRKLRQKVGRSSRKYPASPEKMMEIFLKRGTFPSINLAVDVYNCVSLETRLSLGAHDIDRVDGDVTLALAEGTERFVPLGRDKPEPVGAGEYCYMDDTEVLCRMEYRQADKSKVMLESERCLFIVQGNENTPCEDVRGVAQRLMEMVRVYCGGSGRMVWTCA